MFCIRNIPRSRFSSPVRLISRANYSRRSDKITSSYKHVQTDDVDDEFANTISGLNPNWELITPIGFRFYLPGSIGPGWLGHSTISKVQILESMLPNDSCDFKLINLLNTDKSKSDNTEIFSLVKYSSQECPTLLKKGVKELFPDFPAYPGTQIAMITISQKIKNKSRMSKEIETEKLAQYFVLAAAGICGKLISSGYWADFINPFSGRPYFCRQKNDSLYKTDERFRCVGFKVEERMYCKIIESDNKNFIGHLFTNASAQYFQRLYSKEESEEKDEGD